MAVKTKKKTATKIKKKVVKSVETKQDTLIVLDLGCGSNKITPEGVVNNAILDPDKQSQIKVVGVDLQKTDQMDVQHDLTKFPYPFADESIDGVFSSHFLEHLDGFERIKFFDEMYRILKPEAKMRLIHPHARSNRAIQDPTHKWPPICEDSYLYWWKAWREGNKLEHYLGKCDYQYNIFYTWMDPIWANKNEEQRNFAIKHYWNVVADMIVDLTKR